MKKFQVIVESKSFSCDCVISEKKIIRKNFEGRRNSFIKEPYLITAAMGGEKNLYMPAGVIKRKKKRYDWPSVDKLIVKIKEVQ